jgi:hypothetical protein
MAGQIPVSSILRVARILACLPTQTHADADRTLTEQLTASRRSRARAGQWETVIWRDWNEPSHPKSWTRWLAHHGRLARSAFTTMICTRLTDLHHRHLPPSPAGGGRPVNKRPWNDLPTSCHRLTVSFASALTEFWNFCVQVCWWADTTTGTGKVQDTEHERSLVASSSSI